MAKDIDILVLGATGFTGRLITRYLSNHPRKAEFKLALGARSKRRLDALAEELKLSDDVARIVVDVSNEQSLQSAIAQAKVVANTVGPYTKYSSPVIAECAKTGTHYVDLSGEPRWSYQMIHKYDFLAMKTGAIIVPGCGFDSLPFDAAVFLSVKTLKDKLGAETQVKESISYFSLNEGFSGGSAATLRGEKDTMLKKKVASDAPVNGGFSGGSVATLLGSLEEKDAALKKRVDSDVFALSPVKGNRPPSRLYHYSKQIDTAGVSWLMAAINRPLVYRSWGLKQVESKTAAYGSDFTYEEYWTMGGTLLSSIFMSVLVSLIMGILSYFPLARWLLRKVGPAPGEGPSDEAMQDGSFKVVNITASATQPPVYAKSVQTGNGNHGYLLTSMMVSECALLLLKPSELTPASQKGGMLTPTTAFGSKIFESLESTGRFTYSCEILPSDGDDKKTK